MDTLISTLTVIVILTLIIWVIGIALALSRWRRRPRVSLFTLLAFAMSTFDNKSREQNATP